MSLTFNMPLTQYSYNIGSSGKFEEYVAGNDGAPANAPVFATDQFGRINSATVFTVASSDRVTLPDLAETANGSISLWFNSTNNINSGTGRMGLLGATSPPRVVLGFNVDEATGKLQLAIHDNTAWRRVKSNATSWTAGTWYNVIATWGGAGNEIFINNVSNNTIGAFSPFSQVGPSWLIGYDGSGYFGGAINSVHLYDHVLSAAERATLFAGVYTQSLSGGLTPNGTLEGRNPNWLLIPDYLNWRQTWNATISYNVDDVVLYQEDNLIHAFVSKTDHNVGNIPTTAYPHWTRLVQEKFNR